MTAPCRHWDKIQSPHGPISKARCIFCGREREYLTPYDGSYNTVWVGKTAPVERPDDWND